MIEKSEEEPEAMYDYLSKALDFYGINKCIIDKSLIPGYIASIGDEYSKEYDITVFTADNMYFQLVKEHVSVIKFKNGMNVLYDDAHIRERFKVFPSQYADFITLVGDKKTGLCSIDKISAKAAMILLERYGSIEGILSNYEYIRKLPIRVYVRTWKR